uniref:putative nuclease HARBI1 n=1 Tax=Pristiophorus japonicus TaxID=55135 RepID=UPI00398EE6FF
MGALLAVPLALEYLRESERRQRRRGEGARRGRRRRRRRQHRRALNRRPYLPRVFREHFSYIHLSEEQCTRRLRFTKEVVTELCHLLQPELQPQSRATTALPVALKVTVALHFFASGSFQSAGGNIANVSQFAVYCCIREVTDALYARRKDYVFFCLSREKQEERARGFARIAGFPMVQGAIDCTHVALRAPHNNPEIFSNRKGYHSLNVQLLCDHTQRILMVNARYPGSSHDAFILRQSSVPAIFQPPHQTQGWLLGDQGYPLCTWLMTPLRNPTTPAQLSYNESHAATRNVIKQTIGLLKQRFRCLDRSGGALQYTPERVSHFVVVCCMLHNLAIMRAQPLPARIVEPSQEEDEGEEEMEMDEEQEEEEEGRRQPENLPSGQVIRERLINSKSSE